MNHIIDFQQHIIFNNILDVLGFVVCIADWFSTT